MISTMVYPADANVRLAVQYLINRQFHTIHGSAIAGVAFNIITKHMYPCHAQRRTYCDSVAHTALRFVRSYHHYFPQASHCFHQCCNTGGGYPIIIGY